MQIPGKILILTRMLTTAGFFLILTSAEGWAAESALARMHFIVPSERMAEFEVAYRQELLPVLKHHGLVESVRKGRATPDSIFSRLFEFESPSGFLEDRVKIRSAIREDSTVMNVMKRFGTSLGLNLFNAQAGSGKTVPAGDGQGHWRTYNVTDGLAGGNVTSILQDRNGHLWFGAGGDGISRYDGQAWTTFTTEDGLGSNDVQSILQDREGHLWVGSLRSLSRYDGRVWEILKEILNTENSGLKVNSVRSIFQDREGNIWAGTPKGISRYDGRAWTTYTTEDGLAHNSIRTIFQDEMATSGLVLSAV